MENLESKPSAENILIGEKFQSGKEIDDWEKNCIFESAIKHTSNLVNERTDEILGFSQKNQETKRHLSIIILDRINFLYQPGVEMDLFTEVKTSMCKDFLISPENLPDEAFHSFLTGILDKYFDKEISAQVRVDMRYITEMADKMLPLKK